MKTLTSSWWSMAVMSAALGAFTLTGCDVDVEDEGEMPEVEVREGEMPDIEVTPPDVDVHTEKREVTVPDVDIDTERREITVPDVDVDIPDEQDQ
jgi:hypothetical protein